MSQTNFGPGTNLGRTSSTQLNYIEKGLGVLGASSSKTKPQTVDFSALTRPDDADDEVSKSNECTLRSPLPSSSPPSNDVLEPLEEPTDQLTTQPKPDDGKLEAAKEKSSSPDTKSNDTEFK